MDDRENIMGDRSGEPKRRLGYTEEKERGHIEEKEVGANKKLMQV